MHKKLGIQPSLPTTPHAFVLPINTRMTLSLKPRAGPQIGIVYAKRVGYLYILHMFELYYHYSTQQQHAL